MKVLFIARSTLFSSAGGDTTQIVKTAEALAKLGVEYSIQGQNSESFNLKDFDLIHGFNINRPADFLPYIYHGAPPLVVSTVYVTYTEWQEFSRSPWRLVPPSTAEYLKVLARVVRNGDAIPPMSYLLRGHVRSVLDVVRKSSMLLPNSESEGARFRKDFGVNAPQITVPNAIDPKIYDLDTVTPDPRFADSVLCVGRVEGRKNQLELVRAMNGTSIPVKIIGDPSPNHVEYYNQCRKEARANIEFVGHMASHDLARAYKAARVHVLPSWFETTGLTSLEAGAMGCGIVVTRKGDQSEYFEGFAEFCDPADATSIRTAVERAWESGRSLEFRKTILQRYTWDEAARRTLDAYNLVLGQKTA